MIKILHNPRQIVTVNSNGVDYKRGKDMNNVQIVENHSIIVENDSIKNIVPNSSISKIKADVKIDLSDKIVLPGLVECHTHTAFFTATLCSIQIL